LTTTNQNNGSLIYTKAYGKYYSPQYGNNATHLSTARTTSLTNTNATNFKNNYANGLTDYPLDEIGTWKTATMRETIALLIKASQNHLDNSLAQGQKKITSFFAPIDFGDDTPTTSW